MITYCRRGWIWKRSTIIILGCLFFLYFFKREQSAHPVRDEVAAVQKLQPAEFNEESGAQKLQSAELQEDNAELQEDNALKFRRQGDKNLFCNEDFEEQEKQSYKHQLWVGDITEEETKDASLVGSTLHVVISHCDKSLDDHWPLVTELKPASITVYTKCGQPLGEKEVPEMVSVVKLPNVGRCDHGYAHYMVRNYSGDKDDIILFLKDNQYRGTWKIEYRNAIRSWRETAEIAKARGFGCGERPATQATEDVPEEERITFGNSFSLYHDYEMWKIFTVGSYTRLERDKKEGFPSAYANIGEFYRELKVELSGKTVPEYVPVCYGGVFAIKRGQLHKRTKEFWSDVEQHVTRGDNIQESHYLERMWAYLLSDPLTQEQENTLSNIAKCLKCDDPYSLLRCGILETYWQGEKSQQAYQADMN